MGIADRLRCGVAHLLVLGLLIPPAPARADAVGPSDGSTHAEDRGLVGSGGSEAASASADLFTGSASFSLPISAPPGTGGLTPQLALGYSSAARVDSWVGYGWSLGFPSVSRSLKNGTPAYDDDTDLFVFGGEELVPDPTTPGPALPRLYHTRRESFLRLVHEADDTWSASRPDGTLLRFGHPVGPDLGDGSLDPDNARIQNPDGLTFEWLLSRVEDPHGNVYVATYDRRDPGVAYPKEVRYTLRAGTGGSLTSLEGDPSRDRTLTFALEPRPDTPVNHSAGLERSLGHRLDFVDVRAAGALLRRYDLVYGAPSEDSFRTLLREVQLFGADAEAPTPTEPRRTHFAYSSNVLESTTGWGDPVPWPWPADASLLLADGSDAGARLGDVDGDGLPDLFRARATLSADLEEIIPDPDNGIFLNTGSGFGPASTVFVPPTFEIDGEPAVFSFTLETPIGTWGAETVMQDTTGDGRVDLLSRGLAVASDGSSLYYISIPWAEGTEAGFVESGSAYIDEDFLFQFSILALPSSFENSFLFVGGNAQLADLTGDGLPELIVRDTVTNHADPDPPFCLGAEAVGYVAINQGGMDFERLPLQVDFITLDAPIAAWPSCPDSGYIYSAEFNECVSQGAVSPDCVSRHANVRRSFRSFHPSLPWFLQVNQALGNLYVDLNGDGLADSVHATDDAVLSKSLGVSLNDGRRAFVAADEWAIAPMYRVDADAPFAKDLGIRLADVNGDGRVDVLEALEPSGGEPGARSTSLNRGSIDPTPQSPWVDAPDWELPGDLAFALADVSEDRGVRLIDMNGDGMADLVRSHGGTDEVRLNRGRIPDLLVHVETPLGASSEIEYRPSTEFDNTGDDDVPDLPLVIPVVSRITTDDGFGNTGTTTFAYAGGRFDSEERELRGFAEVTQTRELDERQTVTRYHQDAARAGLPESVTVLDALGNPWASVETTYTLDEVEPYVSLPETVTRLEYDGQATPRRSRVELRYDGQPPSAGGESPITLGNRTATIELGEVDASGTDLDPSDTRTTEVDYTPPNLTPYLVDRPAARRVRAGASPGAGALLRESRFFYDGDTTGTAVPTLGDLTQRIDMLGVAGEADPVTTWTYDAYGNVLTQTSPRENAGQVAAGLGTTALEYDPVWLTYPTAVTNGLGHRAEIDTAPAPGVCAFENPPGAGLPHVQRGPNDLATGAEAVRCFDAFGRITLDRASNGLEETTWSYDDSPGAATVTQATKATAGGGQRVSVSSLDGFGRVIETLADGPQGGAVVQTVQYDPAGRVASVSDAQLTTETPRFTTLGYDPLDRVAEVVRPGGRVTTVTRTQGALTVVDPNGNQTRSTADVFGRVVEVVEDDGSPSDRTTYAYTRAGELETVVDRGGNVFAVQYDRLGQRRQLDDPDSGTTTFDRYDADGNLEQRTAAGGVMSWTYDALGRPLSESAGGITHAWAWDAAVAGLGRLATQDDASGHYEAIAYDLQGRTLHEKFVIEGRRLEFQSSFDPLGQRATRTLPTGRILEWERDARGFLTGVRTQGGASYASGIQWEADGAPRTWTLGNGFSSSTLYDPATGRIGEVRLQGGGPVVDSLVYGFDPGDRVQTITGTIGSFDFDYDTLDRLTEATGPYAPGFAPATLQYAFDPLGNLTCRAAADRTNCQATGGTQLVYPTPGPGVVRPHAPLQVDGGPVAYSASGNLTAVGSRAFDYDAFERMTAARQNGAVVAELVHDAAGTLAKITDRSSPRPEVRHLLGDFEWDATRGLARTHVTLAGVRVATHVEPFTPPVETAALPAAPLDPRFVLAITGAPAGIAALLLLLQLVWLRWRGISLPRPALAGATAIVFYLATVSPTWAQIADGDVNADGRLDVADGVLVLRMAGGELQPTPDQLSHGDVAPLEATPNGSLDAGDALLILRAAGGEDVDGDGLDAATELSIGASPFRLDTDGDGLGDLEELEAFTDPSSPDTDGDGLGDAAEVLAGTDPLSADTDGDGIPDAADPSPLEGVLYRHADRLGSAVVVTAADGSVLARTVYRPYGEAVAPVPGGPAAPPEFGFTGQRFVPAVGIYDYGARFYDPTLGRFLQADSIVPDVFDPQSLNRYAYVRNDPINLTDPTGNSFLPMEGGFFGTSGGFGIPGPIGSFGLPPLFDPFPPIGLPGSPIGLPGSSPGLPGASTTPPITQSFAGPAIKIAKIAGILLEGADKGLALADLFEDVANLIQVVQNPESSTADILGAIAAAGLDLAAIGPSDLKRIGNIIGGSRGAARTQRAATREAKRQAGIPASQQPVSQTSPRAPDGTKVGRQQTFDTPRPGGGTQTKSVQVSRDRVGAHALRPQVEAGSVKPGGQLDGAGRPRIQNPGKVRVDFDPDL